MAAESGPRTRLYTYFTILGAVFLVGGIFSFTSSGIGRGGLGVGVGVVLIVGSEWKVRQLGGR